MDDRLAASARMVAGLISQLPASSMIPTGGKLPLLDVIARDGLACEVSLVRGEVNLQPVVRTAGSPGLNTPGLGFSTYTFGGKPWRTYVMAQDGVRIALADRLDVRDALLNDILLSAAVPFAVTLVAGMLLLWFGIGKGLAPLESIRKALASRGADEEAPLQVANPPTELRPLVQTIQQLLERVRSTIFKERRFTDDAAHELRTPLTAVKTHLQVARMAIDQDLGTNLIKDSLSNADVGVKRLQTTLDQLLFLARLGGSGDEVPLQTTDSASAVEAAVSDVETIHDTSSRVKVEWLVDDRQTNLAIPHGLLVSVLRNLIDNALRYAPAGPVTLRVCADGDTHLRFIILDEGPGLAEDEVRQATQRFWRRAGSGQSGSGLGLSIVAAIAETYGCQFSLQRRAHKGLEAVLTVSRFPQAIDQNGQTPLLNFSPIK
jgi:signal transduction histidine kinase